MLYPRTDEHKRGDLEVAKTFEQYVIERLSEHGVVEDHTASTTAIDIKFDEAWVDVKEKRQPLTARWHLLPGVAETDLVVLDELGVRKLLLSYPLAYFLIRDVPGGRLFIASAAVLAVTKRARTVRVSESGHEKAKLVYDMTDFDRIRDVVDLVDICHRDLQNQPWGISGPVGNHKEC